MRVCGNCGCQNEDGSKFCKQCGQRLEGTEGTAVPAEGEARKKGKVLPLMIAVMAVLAITAVCVLLLSGRGDRQETGGSSQPEAGRTIEESEAAKQPGQEGQPEEFAQPEKLENSEDASASTSALDTADIDYSKPVPVPCDISASSVMDVGYSVDNLQDNDLATTWMEGDSGDGTGEYLIYRPQVPGTVIYGIAVAPGWQTNEDFYEFFSAPVALEVSGEGVEETIDLKNYLPDFEQRNNSLRFFRFATPVAAEELTISIAEIRQGGQYPEDTCISELWLYTYWPYGEASEGYWDMTAETAQVDLYEEFILPYSDTQYLTEADLEGLTKEECRLARNEIYARYGYIFDDENLQAYFESCGWYAPKIEPDGFSIDYFNEYEKYNLELIVSYETEMGYR